MFYYACLFFLPLSLCLCLSLSVKLSGSVFLLHLLFPSFCLPTSLILRLSLSFSDCLYPHPSFSLPRNVMSVCLLFLGQISWRHFLTGKPLSNRPTTERGSVESENRVRHGSQLVTAIGT